MAFTESKFRSLSYRSQHKAAAEILSKGLASGSLDDYKEIELWLCLPTALSDEELYDRFHSHMKEAAIVLNEQDYLPEVKRFDRLNKEQITLPIHLYLDNIRSAANVGNILRTAESFGIREICFGGFTPFIDHPKVIGVSKGVIPLLECHRDIHRLNHFFVALETTQQSQPLDSYTPTHPVTLILGNEEYGISKKMLNLAHVIVEIPLLGMKNSLNVSSAFAIGAAALARNYMKLKSLV